nr:hypothetical protein [Escherichia coli]
MAHRHAASRLAEMQRCGFFC